MYSAKVLPKIFTLNTARAVKPKIVTKSKVKNNGSLRFSKEGIGGKRSNLSPVVVNDLPLCGQSTF